MCARQSASGSHSRHKTCNVLLQLVLEASDASGQRISMHDV